MCVLVGCEGRRFYGPQGGLPLPFLTDNQIDITDNNVGELVLFQDDFNLPYYLIDVLCFYIFANGLVHLAYVHRASTRRLPPR